MSKKMEPVYLLRLEIQLPAGYKPLARKFREDWDSIPLTEARRLGRQAKKSGWQLDACADRILKTGTGKTQQSATACALKLAMADIGAGSNAVKIEYLQIKQYPWFFLSTVAIYPQFLRKGEKLLADASAVAAPAHTSLKSLEVVHMVAAVNDERPGPALDDPWKAESAPLPEFRSRRSSELEDGPRSA